MDNYYVLRRGNKYLTYDGLMAFMTEDREKATKFDIKSAMIIDSFMQKQYGLSFGFELVCE